MKAVLFALNGSYNQTNLAVRRLRPCLENRGYSVVLIEGGLRDRDSELLSRLYGEKADAFGFSCYIWNIDRMLKLASDLKKVLPLSKIVFGGPEITYNTERFYGYNYVDTFIKGAGENVIADIFDGKINQRTVDGGDTGLSDGILYREGETDGKLLYYESSVGCPFNCAFCLSSATSGIKQKTAEKTLSELLDFEKTNGTVVKFVDRTFNADIERANRIWEGLLDERYTKKYHFEICATLLNDESYDIISRFPKGKVQFEAGLQSINEDTLRAVSRHTDSKGTLTACKRLLGFGNVHVHLDLIAGLPYETPESIKAAFDSAYFCCDVLQLGFLKLLYGTEMRNNAEKYGTVFSDEPPYTVLSTPQISFAQMNRLHDISDLLERYRDSGSFAQTLEYAISLFGSPYGFFDGLSDYIVKTDGRNIRHIGQNDAYSLLFRFVSTLTGADTDELTRRVHSDYSASEVRRPPVLTKGNNRKGKARI